MDERDKNTEINCHFVRSKVLDKKIYLFHSTSNQQTDDFFTKSLNPKLSPSMGLVGLYATSRFVLEIRIYKNICMKNQLLSANNSIGDLFPCVIHHSAYIYFPLCKYFPGFLELIEQAGRSQQKWVMCPTCRQHTDSENVAYVHDRKSDVCDMMDSNSFHGQELSEMAIKIKGSYGTKVDLQVYSIFSILTISLFIYS